MIRQYLLTATAGLFLFCNQLPAADHVVYEGDSGPGKGKHILFIASDHEYRGEETCPAIARIMAKRYGFKCTVLFGQTPEGLIKPGSSLIPGIDAIDDADDVCNSLAAVVNALHGLDDLADHLSPMYCHR